MELRGALKAIHPGMLERFLDEDGRSMNNTYCNITSRIHTVNMHRRHGSHQGRFGLPDAFRSL